LIGGDEDDALAKAILASLAQEDKPEDKHDLFGKQVAQMMRDIPPKKVMMLQAKVMLQIAEAQEE